MDGPLIQAMAGGHIFLADEISLADDSVLERLNSLLGKLVAVSRFQIYKDLHHHPEKGVLYTVSGFAIKHSSYKLTQSIWINQIIE